MEKAEVVTSERGWGDCSVKLMSADEEMLQFTCKTGKRMRWISMSKYLEMKIVLEF